MAVLESRAGAGGAVTRWEIGVGAVLAMSSFGRVEGIEEGAGGVWSIAGAMGGAGSVLTGGCS